MGLLPWKITVHSPRLSMMVMLQVWKRYISEIAVSHGDDEIQETTRQGWALVEWNARLVGVIEVQLKSVKEKMEARRLREASDLVSTLNCVVPSFTLTISVFLSRQL